MDVAALRDPRGRARGPRVALLALLALLSLALLARAVSMMDFSTIGAVGIGFLIIGALTLLVLAPVLAAGAVAGWGVKRLRKRQGEARERASEGAPTGRGSRSLDTRRLGTCRAGDT